MSGWYERLVRGRHAWAPIMKYSPVKKGNCHSKENPTHGKYGRGCAQGLRPDRGRPWTDRADPKLQTTRNAASVPDRVCGNVDNARFGHHAVDAGMVSSVGHLCPRSHRQTLSLTLQDRSSTSSGTKRGCGRCWRHGEKALARRVSTSGRGRGHGEGPAGLVLHRFV